MTFTNWPIVVKPGSILEDSSPWTIVTSRMKSWHDMAAPVLDDAELYVECRRWLTGDPPPWDGAPTLRNGTLVVDIIDKSGFREGTSLAGSLITGLARTVADTIGDDVEDSYDLITGEPTPPEGYRIPNQLRTWPRTRTSSIATARSPASNSRRSPAKPLVHAEYRPAANQPHLSTR